MFWLPVRRGRPLHGYSLLSGSCRERCGSPEPPLLQAQHPQLPQPLFIGLVLQTLPRLRCPSLHSSSSVPAVSPLPVSWPARPLAARFDGWLSATQGGAPMCPWGMPSGYPHRPSLPSPGVLRNHCTASIHPIAHPAFLHLANTDLVVQVQRNLVGELEFCGELHH